MYMLRTTTKVISTAVFIAAVCLIPLASAAFAQTAAANPKTLLLGRWKSDEAVIEFRSNGSITINDEEYIYKVKNSVITVSNLEGSMAFPYSLDGDTLIVDFQGREIVYRRLKAGSDKAVIGKGGNSGTGVGGIVPEFVGKWCYLANLTGSNSYRSSRCFTLYANGTYEYSGETSSSGAYGSSVGQSYDTGRWAATRTTLTAVSNKNGTITYPIELRNHPKNGDPMIVVDGDAYVTQTQRPSW